jgi:hypothetical protein
MSRHIRSLVILAALCGIPSELSAQITKYGVTVDVVNAAALSKVRTYSFVPGQPAYDKVVDQQIISALDREMTARAMTKVAEAERPDVLVTYLSLRRTDVDLKSKPIGQEGTRRQYPVGTLVVAVLDPVDRQKKLFNVRVDKPLDLDPATFEATINDAVAAIFAKYPQKK